MAFDDEDRREDLLETILHRLDELENLYIKSFPEVPSAHIAGRFARIRMRARQDLRDIEELANNLKEREND